MDVRVDKATDAARFGAIYLTKIDAVIAVGIPARRQAGRMAFSADGAMPNIAGSKDERTDRRQQSI